MQKLWRSQVLVPAGTYVSIYEKPSELKDEDMPSWKDIAQNWGGSSASGYILALKTGGDLHEVRGCDG